MKNAFSSLNNLLKIRKPEEEDDCDLYGKMLAKKLRRLPEEERQTFMYEIDGMFIRRYRNSVPSYSSYSQPVESNISNRPSTSHSSYSDNYSPYSQASPTNYPSSIHSNNHSLDSPIMSPEINIPTHISHAPTNPSHTITVLSDVKIANQSLLNEAYCNAMDEYNK